MRRESPVAWGVKRFRFQRCLAANAAVGSAEPASRWARTEARCPGHEKGLCSSPLAEPLTTKMG